MGVFSLKPTRKVENVQVVADLDKLIAEPIAFRWNGKVHTIKPLTTKQFFKVTQELAEVDLMARKVKEDRDSVTAERLMEMYANLFASVCDTIGKREVAEMQQAQIGALLNLVIECVTGKVHASDEKKKTVAESEAPQRSYS